MLPSHLCLFWGNAVALTAASESGGGIPPLAAALIWLGVIIATLAIEAATTDMVSVWFAPGALVAMILAVLDVSVPIQIVVFIVISVILLILAKTVLKKFFVDKHKPEKMNADALVGKRAAVREPIDFDGDTGVVSINGQLWTALMESESDRAEVGEHVEIVRVEGAKLIVRPLR